MRIQIHTSIHSGLNQGKKACRRGHIRYEKRNLVPTPSFSFPTYHPLGRAPSSFSDGIFPDDNLYLEGGHWAGAVSASPHHVRSGVRRAAWNLTARPESHALRALTSG